MRIGTVQLINSRRAGFTLTEVLVIITIIAILALITVTSIASAKRKAHDLTCLNNLKQLSIAWHLYATDNNDRLAPNCSSGPGLAGQYPTVPAWVSGYLNYLDINSDNTNIHLLTSGYGSIGPYSKEPKLYKCPGDTSYVMPAGLKAPRVRSYSMNAFVGDSNENFVEGAPYVMFRKYAQLAAASSSGIWVLIDEHEDSISGGIFWLPCGFRGKATGWQAVPSARHSGGANLAFADGSVDHHAWHDSRTLVPVIRKPQSRLACPFNADVEWLQDRTSIPKDPAAITHVPPSRL